MVDRVSVPEREHRLVTAASSPCTVMKLLMDEERFGRLYQAAGLQTSLSRSLIPETQMWVPNCGMDIGKIGESLHALIDFRNPKHGCQFR
jgi:hypothetical protein